MSSSASTGSPNPGAAFTYTFQVKNSGPDAATGTIFTEATVTISASAPVTAGTYSTTGTASSGVTDPQPTNNAVTVTVQVKTSLSAVGVVTYSNLGAVPPPANGGGYAIVGLQATGFFSYIGDQFVPTVSGSISSIRLPIHQYDTGGNGAFTVQVYTDNADTLGTVIGSYQGQSIRTTDTSTGLTTVAVSGGAKLVAGQSYWITIQPSAQSREAVAPNQIGVTGNHLYVDSNQTLYSAGTDQAAFEIKVLP